MKHSLAVAITTVDHGNGRRVGLQFTHPLFDRPRCVYLTPAEARRLAASLLMFAGDVRPLWRAE